MSTVTEQQLITQTVLDYFEGWFDGDAVRMDRALHPKLVKRSDALRRIVTKEHMVGWTAAGQGKEDDSPERRIDVEVVDVHGNIATAVVRSHVYHEYVHLVQTEDGWKIVNALLNRT